LNTAIEANATILEAKFIKYQQEIESLEQAIEACMKAAAVQADQMTENATRYHQKHIFDEERVSKLEGDIIILNNYWTDYLNTHDTFSKGTSGITPLLEKAASIVGTGIRGTPLPRGSSHDTAFDMDALLQFDPSTWIKNHKGTASLFVNSFLLPLLKSLYPSTIELEEEEYTKAIAQILACVHSFRDDNFINPLGLILAIVVSTKTSSPQIVDLVSEIVSGGVRQSYIDSRMQKAVNNVGNLSDIVNLNLCRIVGIYDNNGIYRQKTNESTNPDNKSEAVSATWTNAAVVYCYDADKSDVLQHLHIYGRSGWNLISNCDKELLTFGSDKMPRVAYNNSNSHVEILRDAKHASYTSAYDRYEYIRNKLSHL
jgi:hypothetical protein